MPKSLAASLVVVAFTVGVVAGAVMARRDRSEKPAPAPRGISAAPTPGSGTQPQPSSDAEGTSQDSTRVAELENEVRELRHANEQALQALKALSSGDLSKLPAGALKIDPATLGSSLANLTQDMEGVVEFFDLDAGRADQLKRAHDQMMEKIRQTEVELAKVKTDGDLTRIDIPAFGDRAKALKEDWDRNLAGILTASERERYTRNNLERALFPNGMGAEPRSIDIKRQGSETTVTDSYGGGSSGFGRKTVITGDDYDSMVAPYKHLLK